MLLERTHSPFEGSRVLPGGLVDPDETAREARVREVSEEAGRWDRSTRPICQRWASTTSGSSLTRSSTDRRIDESNRELAVRPR
ncbi:NUDIX domain-containing protein [Haloplanus halophilus]|uniref:NUDIX domain-containing protein n=1 Tax=Haloplanus halophilus TaxID=2949993 RepID=UPI00203F97B1|nr:NUDIX domain-containing protein [Haloplanus sp. GDY1]